MQLTPFWTDQTPVPPDLPRSDLPSEVDVAVVGSGVTGLNAALELAKAGVNVAVLDQQEIGWGASSRNGGMATPGIKQSMVNIFKRDQTVDIKVRL